MRAYDLAASAALTRSGVNGTSRMRAPVASKIALPIAPATTVMAVSPAPLAGAPGRYEIDLEGVDLGRIDPFGRGGGLIRR